MLLLSSQKIYLSIVVSDYSRENAISLHDQRHRCVPLFEDTEPADNTLLITNAPKNPIAMANELYIETLVTAHRGKVLQGSAYGTLRGTWRQQGDLTCGGGFLSDRAGSSMIYEGYTSDLTLTLKKGPRAGKAEISWNGRVRVVDLYAPEEGWERVTLESPRRVLYASVPWYCPVLYVTVGGGGLHAEKLSLIFGNEVLHEERNTVLRDGTSVHLKKYTAGISWALLSNALLFIARCVFLCGVYMLAGVPVVLPLWVFLSGVERCTLAFLVGFSIASVTSGALCYLFPVREAMLIAFLGLSLLYAVQISRYGLLRKIWQSPLMDPYEPAGKFLFCVALLSTLVMFFPAIVEPGWYFGQSYTDSFEYVNYPQIFLHASPGAVGFDVYAYRFVDMVVMGMNAVLLRSSTAASYAVSCAALWFMLPFIAYVLFARCLRLDKTIAWWGVGALSLSANLFSLFSQCYIAQFMAAFLLIANVTVTALIVTHGEILHGCRMRWTALPVACTYALSLAVYPYHFLLPLGVLVAALVDCIVTGRTLWVRWVLLLGLLCCVILNVNLLPVINWYKGHIDWKRLDEIGRYVVFPFYGSLTADASIALGLKDIVLNSNFFNDLTRELIIGHRRLLGYACGILPHVRAVVMWTSLVWCIMGIASCMAKRGGIFLVIGTTCIVYLSVCGYYWARDQVYQFVKFLLTTGPLLIVSICIGCTAMVGWCRTPRAALLLRRISTILFVAFITLNFVSVWCDHATLLLNRNSVLLYRLRTHVGTITDGLKSFEKFVNAGTSPLAHQKIIILGEYTDVYGTDNDRVIYNRILHVLRDNDVLYADGRTRHLAKTFNFGYYGKPVDLSSVDYVLMFRGYRGGELESAGLVFLNDIFKLYKIHHAPHAHGASLPMRAPGQ